MFKLMRLHIHIHILCILLTYKHDYHVRGFFIPSVIPLKGTVGTTNISNKITIMEGVHAHDLAEITEEEAWEEAIDIARSNSPYRFSEDSMISAYNSTDLLEMINNNNDDDDDDDDALLGEVLWELIRKEAEQSIQSEIQAGPFLYQFILSQPSLVDAIINFISNEIATELMPATSICNLFHQTLQEDDKVFIHLDAVAASMRKHDVGLLIGVLFNKGLHALVCHRVSHRLWKDDRKGLAYYIQSTISSKYSADIHPAATIGQGIYLNSGKGVVIGETSVIGNDVTILQGVTLGGTGKERGDRHPKVGNGVILYDGATVLGNIIVGDGAVVTAKSIVTKVCIRVLFSNTHTLTLFFIVYMQGCPSFC